MIYYFYTFVFTETELAISKIINNQFILFHNSIIYSFFFNFQTIGKKSILNLIIQIGLLLYLVLDCIAIYFLFDLIRLHTLLGIK